ncbi:alpha/beta-hydrolase [Cubamyces menziesii]|nr:alpha/beta-hydrolase [Cubamyces menziesii]
MDTALYKDKKVSRGFTYHYFYHPATLGQPTLLILHGFPSSSYGWHRQVEYFRPKGYGLLIPDLLGAGDTEKPEDPQAFRMALIARDLIDLLDAEGLDKVVGIGHDWGSVVLSRTANLFQDRFHAFIWNVVAYSPPSHQRMDINAAIARLQSLTGNARYGYWKWYNEDDAYEICDKNIDAFVQLAYPESPEIWLEWLTPPGKAKQWTEENRQLGLPSWLTQDEYNKFRDTLAKGGLKSYLNYYKVAVRSLNYEDDQKIAQDAWVIQKPTLFVAAKYDAVATPAMGKANIEKYVPQAKIVELECGHWVQLEQTERLNEVWEKWIEGLGLRSAKSTL